MIRAFCYKGDALEFGCCCGGPQCCDETARLAHPSKVYDERKLCLYSRRHQAQKASCSSLGMHVDETHSPASPNRKAEDALH